MAGMMRNPWAGFFSAILLGVVLGGAAFTLNEVLQSRSYPAEHIKGIEELSLLGKGIRGLKIGVVIGALSGLFAGLLLIVGRLGGSTNT